MLLWHLEILRSKVICKYKILLFNELRERTSCFRKWEGYVCVQYKNSHLKLYLKENAKENCYAFRVYFPIISKNIA